MQETAKLELLKDKELSRSQTWEKRRIPPSRVALVSTDGKSLRSSQRTRPSLITEALRTSRSSPNSSAIGSTTSTRRRMQRYSSAEMLRRQRRSEGARRPRRRSIPPWGFDSWMMRSGVERCTIAAMSISRSLRARFPHLRRSLSLVDRRVQCGFFDIIAVSSRSLVFRHSLRLLEHCFWSTHSRWESPGSALNGYA